MTSEGSTEAAGSIALNTVYARPTFGFGDPNRLPADFDIDRRDRRPTPQEHGSAPMRLNPYGPDEAVPPDSFAGAIVVSSLIEPDPEFGGEPVEEVPLELYKENGEIVAARVGYLTWLLNDMRNMGSDDAESQINIEHGKWVEVGTLSLATDRCVALDPHERGARTEFSVTPGQYVAEVFTFDDPDLGYFECATGLRIRWRD